MGKRKEEKERKKKLFEYKKLIDLSEKFIINMTIFFYFNNITLIRYFIVINKNIKIKKI